MKTLVTVAVLLIASIAAYADGPKPCEDLKAEIARKVEANGVKTYSLEIVAKEKDDVQGKVVGTCEGSTKKIVYSKTATPAQTTTQAAAAPTTKP
jgi:hypothetical protein